MKLTAIVRSARNGNVKKIIDDFASKTEFTKEIRANGLRVLAVLTDADIERIKTSRFYFDCKVSDTVFEYVNQCL